MKTTFTFALALTIQVMVYGQTPGNQARMIRMELCPETSETTQPQVITVDKLLDEEQQLKDEIKATQKKLIQKQVAVSRIKSYMAYEVFASNNRMIADLAANPSLKAMTIEKSQGLNNLAAQEIKLAKEIREEADAQATPEAQLAELSNAEEKETLALAQQQEAIKLLKLGAPLFIRQQAPEFTVSNITGAKPSLQETLYDHELSWLGQQAGDMKSTVEQLRTAAIGKTGNEKAAMLDEAFAMEQEYIAARIELAILQYHRTEKTYLENKTFIALFIEGIGDDALTRKARLLSEEADYNFRLGKEMREEANAQFTKAARFGEMSNAEEKELLALSQQQQSVDALKKLNRSFLLASN